MKLATLFFLCIGINLYAQDIYLKGAVQDSTKTALQTASLVVSNAKTQKFQGYAITDDDGLFAIKLTKNEDFIVKLTYMGYKTIIDTITVKENDIYKKYILKPDVTQLDGVEISYEMPVTIKGDTIIYNADSFTTGNEKKLGDVLKKMPSIEVEKNGTVKVEGKEVKKVMIEGKDFFGGDSKLASKNIPANAIQKVEVLRNYNANSQVKDFEDNEDSFALNIKLKKGKETFWFGDIKAGLGLPGKHILHPKLFYYSPKNTYNFIGDINNIGNPPLSQNEIFKMTGGFDNLMRKSGSVFNQSDNQLGFATRQNDKVQDQKGKFAAFNYHIPINKNLYVKGFFIGNSDAVNYYNETKKTYSATNISEQNIRDSKQKSHSAIAKITMDYNPNDKLSFKYKALYKNLSTNENTANISNINGNTENLKTAKTTAFNQHFEVYKTLKNDHLIAFEIEQQFKQNIPLLEMISSNEFFTNSALIQLSPQNQFDLLQNQETDINKVTGVLDYYYILNDVSHLNISVGNEWIKQQYHSGIQQKMDNQQVQDLGNQQLFNQADYRFYNQYLGLHYKLLWKKFLIRPSLNLHYYVLEDTQFNDTKTHKKWSLLPKLNVKYSLKRGKNIRFSYQISNAFSDIQKYAKGYVLSNYNYLKGGNRDLDNVYNHLFSLNYSSYSMSKFQYLFATVSYSKKINSIRDKTVFQQTDLISLPVNINHADENINLSLSYSKRYPYWNYRLSTSEMWNKYYSIINTNEVVSNSSLQNYHLKTSSNLSGLFNFDLGYSLNVNNFKNNINSSRYITHKSSVGLELSFFKKSLLIKPKYDFYNYSNKNGSTKNKYAFLNTELFYQKEGSKWEFILSASNMLGVKNLTKENLNDLYISTSKYAIQPSIWMLSVNYKL